MIFSHHILSFQCQPWINKPPGWLIARVDLRITVRLLEEYPLISKPWFINPGLTLYPLPFPLTGFRSHLTVL